MEPITTNPEGVYSNTFENESKSNYNFSRWNFNP